jgi:hypothetical protein
MQNLSTAMSVAARVILVDNSSKAFRLLLIRDENRRPTIAKRLSSWMLKAVPEEYRT